MNWLIKNISGNNYKISSTLWNNCYYNCYYNGLKTETYVYKMDKVDDKISRRFVDAMIYSPGCTLDQITQD
jgi:hypothetical protein